MLCAAHLGQAGKGVGVGPAGSSGDEARVQQQDGVAVGLHAIVHIGGLQRMGNTSKLAEYRDEFVIASMH